jgi:hypothetical protein
MEVSPDRREFKPTQAPADTRGMDTTFAAMDGTANWESDDVARRWEDDDGTLWSSRTGVAHGTPCEFLLEQRHVDGVHDMRAWMKTVIGGRHHEYRTRWLTECGGEEQFEAEMGATFQPMFDALKGD